MSGSARPPLTSLTRRAPASSAAWATSARIVSTLTGTFSWASPAITGITRRSSSAAGIRCAPGRVDSPPTSTMSAPCAASCRPRVIAASVPNHSPPSEKESGVTFTTPMTRQRPGSGSPGGLEPRGAPASGPGPAGAPAGASLVTRVTLRPPSDAVPARPGFQPLSHLVQKLQEPRRGSDPPVAEWKPACRALPGLAGQRVGAGWAAARVSQIVGVGKVVAGAGRPPARGCLVMARGGRCGQACGHGPVLARGQRAGRRGRLGPPPGPPERANQPGYPQPARDAANLQG